MPRIERFWAILLPLPNSTYSPPSLDGDRVSEEDRTLLEVCAEPVCSEDADCFEEAVWLPGVCAELVSDEAEDWEEAASDDAAELAGLFSLEAEAVNSV